MTDTEATQVDLLPPEPCRVTVRLVVAFGLGGHACLVEGESEPATWWEDFLEDSSSLHPSDCLNIGTPDNPGVYRWEGAITGPFEEDTDLCWQGHFSRLGFEDPAPDTQRMPDAHF